MRTSILLSTGAVLAALSLAAVAAEPCRYSEPRHVQTDGAGLQELLVKIGPDRLVLRGEPGITQVTATGTACASNRDWLKDIRLSLARNGAHGTLTADDGNHGVFHTLFGGSYAYMKLDVQVPQAVAIRLQQGSGDANVGGVAALDAVLGSGDLDAKGIRGRFGLQVGSGDANASDVGSLELSHLGSGDVNVDGVHGDARVGSVGSGDLTLANIKGNVTLGSVNSGDVKLRKVGGSLKADSVGSGDLVVNGVTGDVTVGAVASGDVRITDAGANVHAGSVGSGDFGADGVAGNFSVGAVGTGDVHHRGVKGTVSVPAGH